MHTCGLFVIQSISDDRVVKCINIYKLQADIKQTRNKIYEYHRCSPNDRDQAFIDRVLEREKTIVSLLADIVYFVDDCVFRN